LITRDSSASLNEIHSTNSSNDSKLQRGGWRDVHAARCSAVKFRAGTARGKTTAGKNRFGSGMEIIRRTLQGEQRSCPKSQISSRRGLTALAEFTP
jgi:hypothetical protein